MENNNSYFVEKLLSRKLYNIIMAATCSLVQEKLSDYKTITYNGKIIEQYVHNCIINIALRTTYSIKR